MTDVTIEQWLRGVSLFRHLDSARIRDLAARCRFRRYQPGAYLFYEDDPAHSLYLIMSGGVTIERLDMEGNPIHVGQHRAGEWLGEAPYLDNNRHMFGARVEQVCDILMLHYTDFKEMFGRDPELFTEMARVLSQRLRASAFQFVQKESQDIRHRLIDELHARTAEIDRQPGSEIVLDDLSDARIAQRIGASRESVNRHIAQFKKQGIVRRDGKNLVILRPERLAALTDHTLAHP